VPGEQIQPATDIAKAVENATEPRVPFCFHPILQSDAADQAWKQFLGFCRDVFANHRHSSLSPKMCGSGREHRISDRKDEICWIHNWQESEMLKTNSVVAVYDTQTGVETAVRELQGKFDLTKLSVLGREHESGGRLLGFYVAPGGRLRYMGPRGAFWNELWDVLAGEACFTISTIGRVLVAGQLAMGIVDAKDDPVEGLSDVGSCLYSMSIPKVSIQRYETALKMHKLLLVAFGSVREVLQIKDLLRGSHPMETNIHFATEGAQSAA
jgi:hypothetical protein